MSCGLQYILYIYIYLFIHLLPVFATSEKCMKHKIVCGMV